MAGSTLKEGVGLLDGWLHIEARGRFTGCTLKEGTCVVNGWLHIEGR